MITLDMTRKGATKFVTDNAFTLEQGVLTLQVSLGTYSLTGKTVTAAFSPKLAETGALNVVAGVIQIPISPSLIQAGLNEIQLNIRASGFLEQSPKMEWVVLESIIAATTPTPDPGILGTILADIAQAEIDIDALETGKVDKVTGKALSTNDFTDAFETKLTDLPLASDLTISLGTKVDKVTGKELSENDFTDTLKTKLDGIADSANNYTHPTNHAPSIISQDTSNRFVTDTEKSTWNGKQDALGFTAENVANKKTSLTDNSDTFYPSQKAVKTAVDAKTDKFMATNLVTNGDFSNGTTGWSAAGATIVSVVSNELTFLGSGTNASLRELISVISGHKYYAKISLKATSNLVRIAFYDGATVQQGTLHSGSGLYETITQIFTAGNTSASAQLQPIRDNRTSAWDNVYTKYILFIDLTAIFGAGNEPTANQMDLLMANFPNSWFNGTVELVNVQQMLNYINDLETELHEKTSYGVITGLVAAQQTVADMTVKVSAGTIYMANGDRFTPSATASLAVTTADATNPRIDIVYVSSTGVVSYLAGTAGVSPSQPATPAGGQLLATILVTAGKTSILTADITQRKRYLFRDDQFVLTLLNGYVVYAAGNDIKICKDQAGVVHVTGKVKTGTATGSTNPICVLPVGYRPGAGYRSFPAAHGNTNSVSVGIQASNGNLYTDTAYTSFLSLDGISFLAEA